MKLQLTKEVVEKCETWSRFAGTTPPKYESPVECSWLGTVELIEKCLLVCKEVYLLEDKEASSSETTMTGEKMTEFIEEWILAGRDPQEVKLWGHSHASGTAFQSATDKQTVKDLFGAFDFGIGLTYTSAGDSYAELTLFEPIYLPEMKLDIIKPGRAWDKKLAAEAMEKIQKKVYKRMVQQESREQMILPASAPLKGPLTPSQAMQYHPSEWDRQNVDVLLKNYEGRQVSHLTRKGNHIIVFTVVDGKLYKEMTDPRDPEALKMSTVSEADKMFALRLYREKGYLDYRSSPNPSEPAQTEPKEMA